MNTTTNLKEYVKKDAARCVVVDMEMEELMKQKKMYEEDTI